MAYPTALHIGWPCHMDALPGPSIARGLGATSLTQPLHSKGVRPCSPRLLVHAPTLPFPAPAPSLL